MPGKVSFLTLLHVLACWWQIPLLLAYFALTWDTHTDTHTVVTQFLPPVLYSLCSFERKLELCWLNGISYDVWEVRICVAELHLLILCGTALVSSDTTRHTHTLTHPHTIIKLDLLYSRLRLMLACSLSLPLPRAGLTALTSVKQAPCVEFTKAAIINSSPSQATGCAQIYCCHFGRQLVILRRQNTQTTISANLTVG